MGYKSKYKGAQIDEAVGKVLNNEIEGGGDSLFEKGGSENSAVLKEGNNIAGLKGWYYKAIQFNTNTGNMYLYLTQIQQIPGVVTTVKDVSNPETTISFNLTNGTVLSIINDVKYNNQFRLVGNEISKYGRIIVKPLSGEFPFNDIKTDDDLNNNKFNSEDYSVYSIDNPLSGIADMGEFSVAFGYNNHSYGKFSFTEGRDNKAAYCSHAEGYGSIANGEYSHVEGYNTITTNAIEHASGKYNNSIAKTDSNTTAEATHFSIGIGTSDTDRKNAFEVKQNGDIYIEGVSGRIQDKLNSSNGGGQLLINITYSELKSLRDNSQLVVGQQYRITDYMTTTTQENTQSAGHQFDIIVTADDVNVLNEKARAIQHEGDSYFANSNLNAWELKYCLDNDTDRFEWADTTNGKGVIYYMKDDRNNECPYDFKNIQFARWELSNPVGYRNDFDNGEDNWIQETTAFDSIKTGFYGLGGSTNVFYYGYDNKGHYKYKVEYTISESPTYCYTFGKDTDYSMDGSNYGNVIKKHEVEYVIQLNNIVFLSASCRSNSFGYNCFSNSFGFGCYSNSFGDLCYSNSFGDDYYNNSFGYGCSSNSFGDLCFSNSFGNYCGYNSFCYECSNNRFGNACDKNSFGDLCSFNSFGNNCYSNSFGNECHNNSFGYSCFENSFGDYFSSNSFGNSCYNNTFGSSCVSNSFGNACYKNSFGVYCFSNGFGDVCSNNSFGYNCYFNSFGESFISNNFGNDCNSNSFGNDCCYNSFGDDCLYNSFGNHCLYNSFGESCYYNSFGNNCHSNSFGNNCHSNSFGNDCYSNSFGESKDNLKSYYRYIIFDNGNSAINLNCTSTTGSSKYYQNVRICLGVNNTGNYKIISDSNVNQTYQTLYKPSNSKDLTA